MRAIDGNTNSHLANSRHRHERCARAVRRALLVACATMLGTGGAFHAAAQNEGSGQSASNAVVAQGAQDAQGDANARKNWYNDPFFALSSDVPACPTPLGPLMTKAEADDDAHYRVERGTTCWLAHQCSKPNSYLYDADIAAAIRQQLQGDARFKGASVWITVQRRFVYAEGCVPAGFDSAALERRLLAIPDVEQVFVRVTPTPRGALPYKTLSP